MQHCTLTQPDILIYLGAGDLTEDAGLVASAQMDCSHCYLVEANSEQANELSQVYAKDPKVTVLPLAIANKAEKRDFYHQNLSELSGFNIPPGLKAAYPGLKTIGTEILNTQTVDTLLQNTALSQNGHAQLVIDIPAQVDELLGALLASEHLTALHGLVFSKSTTPLTPEELPAQEWIEKLSNKGFELLSIHESQNPDFMRYQMVKNPLYLPLQQAQTMQVDTQAELVQEQEGREALQADQAVLYAQKMELQEQLTQLQAQLQTSQAQQTEGIEQAQEKIKVLTQECELERNHKDRAHAENQKLTEQNTALKVESEAQTAKLATAQTECENHKNTAQDLIKQQEQTQQKQGELSELLTHTQAQIAELEKTKQQQAQQTQQAQRVTELEQQRQTAQTQNQASQSELAEACKKNAELLHAKQTLEAKLTQEQTEKQTRVSQKQQLQTELETAHKQKQENDTHYDSLLKKFKTQQLELEQTKQTQRLLETELTKAQAQIEIIKELLIK